jgi:hypothetical protein
MEKFQACMASNTIEFTASIPNILKKYINSYLGLEGGNWQRVYFTSLLVFSLRKKIGLNSILSNKTEFFYLNSMHVLSGHCSEIICMTVPRIFQVAADVSSMTSAVPSVPREMACSLGQKL